MNAFVKTLNRGQQPAVGRRLKRVLPLLFLTLSLKAEESTGSKLPPPVSQFIATHCTDCHDDSTKKGDLDLTTLAYQLDQPDNRARWTRVFEMVERNEMPPPEKSKVTSTARQELTAFLDSALTAATQADILQNGRGPVRRLTRVEFENNLRTILEMPDLDIRDKLPEDRDSHGFTKVAALLDVSRVHLDAYLDATEAALHAAVASGIKAPAQVKKRFTGLQLFPGLDSFGGREAMFFARDNRMVPISNKDVQAMTAAQKADATLEMALFRSATWPYFGYPQGFSAKVEGTYRVRFKARAVRQVRDFRLAPAYEPLAFTFRARQPSGPDVSGNVRETGGWMDLLPEAQEFETTIQLKRGETFEYSPLGLPVPFIRTDQGFYYDYPPMPPEGHRGMAVQWLEVMGPIVEPKWPPRSHHVLFDTLPMIAAKPGAALAVEVQSQAPQADAARLMRRFADRAALRPLPDSALAPFVKVIESKLAAGESFAAAMLTGYQTFLCSSHFLYLTEPGPSAPEDGPAIAARLSHLFWNTRPDAELTLLAREGKLREASVLRDQTNRLIADSRCDNFIRTFAEEWLDLRRLRRDLPDVRLYPEYRKDDYLVDSMEKETLAFLSAMVKENLSVTTLVSADFTFVNDRLALHYDLPRTPGSSMRRVSLPSWSPYGGLLTQASLLKHTANGTTTSPVLRGAWVMEKLLGQPAPPPPKSVPAIEPDIRGAKTIREMLARHTQSKTCANCHARFDPVGFALENFDVMGAWRDRYRGMETGEKITGYDPAGHPFTYFVGQAVDASGKLPSGETFKDIRELKSILAAQPRQLAKNFLTHFILHATGTPVRFSERAEVERLLDACAANGYRIQDLMHVVIQSPIFLGYPKTLN